MQICYTNVLFPNIDWDADKIIIRTNSKLNLLELADDNYNFHKLYLSFLKNDYMLYYHFEEQSFFIKRKSISRLWHRQDILKFKDLFYTLENPSMYREGQENNLVVVFSSMPIQDNTISSNIAKRCFFKNYPSLTSHLIPNTYVIRIMDCNLIYGSYYLNTSNYPDYEKQIQDFIEMISYQIKIEHQRVVLYGISKGGTGALYHSLLGDYHSVSVDPLFSLTKYIKEGDSHFTKNFFPEKLTPLFQRVINTANSTNSKIIIGVPKITENYQEYVHLKGQSLKIVDIHDQNLVEHGQIGSNTMIEQVTYINGILLGEI